MPSVSALVDFLRTFGPAAASDSLCDENLGLAQAQFGVKQLDTQAPRLAEICAALLGETPRNVILTGTAGDGKTFHIRKFFLQQYPDRAGDWPGEEGILDATLPNGRALRIIRDLSEITEEEKADELESLIASLLGDTSRPVYLAAANDGQLLKYFRDAGEGSGGTATKAKQIYETFATMLRSDTPTDPTLSLDLLNLSRTWSGETVEAIFNAVLEHESWDAGCEGCPGLEGERPCPIRLNRELLRPVDGAPSAFRSRLHQALRLAAANDQHVPIRQLLTLVVNILLGDAGHPDSPLLDCETARRRATARAYALTNPYNNAVGLNLRPERRQANRVFRIFEVLALGFETNNLIDASLVNGVPKELHDRIFEGETTYGAALFKAAHDEYFLTGSSTAVRDFRRALEAQRRRAFFRLPQIAASEMASPWRLTIFYYGGAYLELVQELASEPRRQIVESYTRRLIQGLNRAFTGLMANDEDQLWLAGTIGKTDDPSGRVATVDAISRTGANAFTLRLSYDATARRPCLVVTPPKYMRLAPDFQLPRLDLRPLLFEYLMRVSQGSLPSSFSRQCHQEIRHFSLITRGAIDALQRGFDDDPQTVRLISLGSRGEIRAEAIEIPRVAP